MKIKYKVEKVSTDIESYGGAPCFHDCWKNVNAGGDWRC